LFLFRLILNIAAKVVVWGYGICRNLYGFNRNMFKAEVSKPGERLVSCDFEVSDYPLVNIHFSQTSYRKKYLHQARAEAVHPANKEERFLLDIVVSEAIILKITGSSSLRLQEQFTSRPGSERISPGMGSIVTDILHGAFHAAFKAAYLKTKVAELLILVLSAQAEENGSQKWSEQDRMAFEKVRNLLGQNLKVTYSIEELAIVAGMNRTKLQSGFKSLFGKTIYNFSLDLKMAHAKAILTKDQQLSLKEISSMLGYSHVNHFSAAFKKKFEISPSYFKRMLGISLPFFMMLA